MFSAFSFKHYLSLVGKRIVVELQFFHFNSFIDVNSKLTELSGISQALAHLDQTRLSFKMISVDLQF